MLGFKQTLAASVNLWGWIWQCHGAQYHYTQHNDIQHQGVRLNRDKRSSFRTQFVSYKQIQVLWIQIKGPYSQHFIFLESYKWDW